jgi:DNA-binding NtrC family response regulator
MLFLKAEGSSLGMADWLAQAAPENPSGKESDPFADVACALWKVISQRGIPFTQAFQEMEKRVLEAAINIQGSTRREIAQRLRTSERTLYYKMRAHGLSHPAS